MLELDNSYLGYKIRYELRQFSYDGTQVSFAGRVEFVEYLSNSPMEQEIWATNRRVAYWNSDIHFFRTLKNNQLAQQGYQAYTDKPTEDPSKRLPYFYQQQAKHLDTVALNQWLTVEKANAVYRLALPRRLELHHLDQQGNFPFYKDKPVDVAWLETNGHPIRFTNSGIVLNPGDCVFSGYLVSRRVADMLPVNFEELPSAQQPRPDPGLWKYRTEVPIFSTDRPYYFSRDVVRFNGFLRYPYRQNAPDSLPALVHVELMNPVTKKILIHQKLLTQQGRFAGQITLPDSVGMSPFYLLRLYTNWMRNFGDSSYAARWLPIVPPTHRLTDQTHPDTGSFANLFDVRVSDSVVVIRSGTVNMTDLLWGTASLTSAELAPETPAAWYVEPTGGMLGGAGTPAFLPERGITVAGRLRNFRAVAGGSAVLTAPAQQLTYFADIGPRGEFSFQNLPLADDQTVLLTFTSTKGKALRLPDVQFDSVQSPPWLPPLPRLLNSPTVVGNPPYAGWNPDAILLAEVSVKAYKPPKPMTTAYKSANYTIQGKDLFDKAVGTNIITALQGRVPGIRIVESTDELGFSKLRITMRGGQTVRGFTSGDVPQPLVLVDGIPFDDINQLSQIPASLVERVEIVNRAENLLGLRGYVGVISIITKNALPGRTASEPEGLNLARKVVHGITPQAIVRKQALAGNYIPLDGHAEISMPLPAATGPYKLVIEGVTRKGNRFRYQRLVKITD